MLILTENTVYELQGGGSHQPRPVYEGESIRRVAEGATLRLIGLQDGSLAVQAAAEERRLEAGIEDEITSLLLLEEEPLRVVMGTEPPHVYNLAEGEERATRNRSFAELDVREDWYTPWGGPAAVRSLARSGDGWVYADVHVGSIMRSPDGGENWEPVTPELHVDVHQVACCPADDRRVYAETADAFWISLDRGNSWRHRAEDLGERYGRAVTVHPEEPELALATVSDGPHGEDVHGQLYRTEDGGRNWTHVADGFPASTRDNIDTFHVVFDAQGLAWAVVGTTLYAGRDRATLWEPFWQAESRIRMLSCRRQACPMDSRSLPGGVDA